MNKYLSFIFACLLSLSVFSQGQTQPEVVQSFRPVFLLGVLGAQIDGDTYSGYKKPGFYFGVGINRQLTKRIELEFDIVFLQKGVRANYKTDSVSLNDPNNNFSLIRLNYVEIPLAIRFSYKKFRWEAGSYFSYLVKNPPFDENQYGMHEDPTFKNTDIGWLIGAGYKLGKNVLVNLRWEYSYIPFRDYNYQVPVTQVYHGQFPRNLFNTGWYNNCMILSLNYKLPPRATAKTDAQ
jgi:opacity protein-like surface antigen